MSSSQQPHFDVCLHSLEVTHLHVAVQFPACLKLSVYNLQSPMRILCLSNPEEGNEEKESSDEDSSALSNLSVRGMRKRDLLVRSRILLSVQFRGRE